MLLAKVGWFYRYDAYIILTGILNIARLAMPLLHKVNSDIPKFPMIKSAALISLGVILFLPFAIRASLSHSQYPTAIKNIFEQHYQMALFIKKYYAGSVIAANDIGAINYLADVKTLDLYGLGTLEVPGARRNKTYDAATIRSLVENNNVEIVMIYNSWFDGNLSPEWEELGRWEITNNVATANDVVSFYSPLTEYSPNAIAHLKDFEEKLPKDVIQSGLYTTRQTP